MLKHLLIVIAVILSWGEIGTADILIVVNSSVPVTSLSQKHLKEIFMGKRVQWNDKSSIYFAMNKDKNLQRKFIKTYLGKSERQFTSHWRNMLFTGKGDLPKEFDSTAELIEYIKITKGAISYVDSRGTDSAAAKNINVVKIKKGGK